MSISRQCYSKSLLVSDDASFPASKDLFLKHKKSHSTPEPLPLSEQSSSKSLRLLFTGQSTSSTLLTTQSSFDTPPENPSYSHPSSLHDRDGVYWKENLSLFHEDKNILLSEKEWLTDSIIHAGQQLLEKKYEGSIHGLQSPILGKSMRMFRSVPPRTKFMQVLHVSDSHWMLVSNIDLQRDCGSDSTVKIYDSYASRRISAKTKINICSIMRPRSRAITFDVINIMRQPNGHDCGLFALANATSLANGIEPSVCKWEVPKMRSHLMACFEAGEMTQFPFKPRKVPFGGNVLNSVKERVYCICRMPNDKATPMIFCGTCKEWFHGDCIGVDISVIGETEKWMCDECKKVIYD